MGWINYSIHTSETKPNFYSLAWYVQHQNLLPKRLLETYNRTNFRFWERKELCWFICCKYYTEIIPSSPGADVPLIGEQWTWTVAYRWSLWMKAEHQGQLTSTLPLVSSTQHHNVQGQVVGVCSSKYPLCLQYSPATSERSRIDRFLLALSSVAWQQIFEHMKGLFPLVTEGWGVAGTT